MDDENGQSEMARLGVVEKRMDRLERALNAILTKLAMPTLEAGSYDADPQPTHTVPMTDQGVVVHPQKIMDLPYQYQSLDVTKGQIRLAFLHPSNEPADPIVINLQTHGLDGAPGGYGIPRYSALSYCWGEQVMDSNIILDGAKFPVTKSLYGALERMRALNLTGFWWIDQICMNQADINERNVQVALMRRIYKRASWVVVWLGDEADDSKLAVNILKILGKPPVHAPGEKAIPYPSLAHDDVLRNWKALYAFFNRPWWTRVWIRQEVAVSEVVTMICGDSSFSIDVLQPALKTLQYAEDLASEMPLPHTLKDPKILDPSTTGLSWDYHVRRLVQQRLRAGKGRRWVELEQLLVQTRGCKATDPKDMVFSMLGLADPEVYSITADYSQDLSSVLMNTMKVIVSKPHGLDILGACPYPGDEHDLPSWVPDLVSPWKVNPFPVVQPDDGSSNDLSRWVASHLAWKSRPEVYIEGKVLNVRGMHSDSISSLCEETVRSNCTALELDDIYNSWKKFTEKTPLTYSHESYGINKSLIGEEDWNTLNWIRFLSALSDTATDLHQEILTSVKERSSASSSRSIGMAMVNVYSESDSSQPVIGTVNQNLARSCFLPGGHNAQPHPNRRIHAALRTYGVGRRICVTTEGNVALVPTDAKVGDSIALLQGASFPYVVRKHTVEGGYVLVGEAFDPQYAEWLQPSIYGFISLL